MKNLSKLLTEVEPDYGGKIGLDECFMKLKTDYDKLKAIAVILANAVDGAEEHLRTVKCLNETIKTVSRLSEFEIGLVQETVKSLQDALTTARKILGDR